MEMNTPCLFGVIQNLSSASAVDDPAAELKARLGGSRLLSKIDPGQKVAIAVGSRGINALAQIVRVLVDAVLQRGAEPFILPAMGSHGGATAQGQKAVLEHLGVTEQSCKAPVVSSMEVKDLGASSCSGARLILSADALRADQVIPLVRVKAHTSYQGKIESGLFKMLVVGLGKEAGARSFHLNAQRSPFPEILISLATEIMEHISIPLGVAVLEDDTGKTSRIELVAAKDFKRTDEKLLAVYKKDAAGLPFKEADLLIVERIGKDISGTGMDTNCIGRSRHLARAEPLTPKLLRIWVRSLSEATKGNAMGIGLADFVSRRLVDDADMKVTIKNALSALCPERSNLPPMLEPEAEILAEAMRTAGVQYPTRSRVAWILDTANLDRVLVSQPLIDSLSAGAVMSSGGKKTHFIFDRQGNLESFERHWSAVD